MLTPGIKHSLTRTVTDAHTAASMGSGELEVFATPAMVALMEQTAWTSVAPHLAEGEGTVGSSLQITHEAPSPVGAEITCESELTEVDGRRLVFSLTCREGDRIVGRGMHERYVINNAKFLDKVKR